MRRSIKSVRQQEVLLYFPIYLFIHTAVGNPDRQVAASPPRQWKVWSAFLLLFELSLIFKCLFQAFPRRGHWRICLISWFHHGAHLYCTKATSSVPSSFSLSLLQSSYTSMTAHKSSYLLHMHLNHRQPEDVRAEVFSRFLKWSYGNQTVALVMNEIVKKTHKHPKCSVNICQSVFSWARKMSRHSLLADLISFLTSSQSFRPHSQLCLGPFSWWR